MLYIPTTGLIRTTVSLLACHPESLQGDNSAIPISGVYPWNSPTHRKHSLRLQRPLTHMLDDSGRSFNPSEDDRFIVRASYLLL